MNIVVRCTACGTVWTPRTIFVRMCSKCRADPLGIHGKIADLVVEEIHVPVFETVNAKYYKVSPYLTIIEADFKLLIERMWDTMKVHGLTVIEPKIIEHRYSPASTPIEAVAALALFKREVFAEEQDGIWIANDIAIPYPSGVLCLSCGYYSKGYRALICPHCGEPLYEVKAWKR